MIYALLQDRVEERHVEFADDVVDDSDRESTRLQRRDTPHHLKNKRVNTMPPPGSAAGQPHPPAPHPADDGQPAADTEDRVRRILARQIVKLCESFDSGSSDHNETTEVRQSPDIMVWSALTKQLTAADARLRSLIQPSMRRSLAATQL